MSASTRASPSRREIGDAAALVIMGGPMSVYEHDQLAHLNAEMRLIESAFEGRAAASWAFAWGANFWPTCWGRRYIPASSKEIGWHEVSLTPAAGDDPTVVGRPDAICRHSIGTAMFSTCRARRSRWPVPN